MQELLNDPSKNLRLLGISPDVPFYDLDLAGTQGAPPPDQLAHPSSPPETNPPTFTQPDMQTPPLAPHDLAGPGIDLYPGTFADPAIPDLDQYPHPYGLAINPHDPLAADPSLVNSSLYDQSNDLAVKCAITEPDPLQPDLQHPDLAPQTHMQDRPGGLDPSALHTMHLGATYQQLDAKTYPAVFMDQSGMNTSRSRHMDLLMRGLDAEEGSL